MARPIGFVMGCGVEGIFRPSFGGENFQQLNVAKVEAYFNLGNSTPP